MNDPDVPMRPVLIWHLVEEVLTQERPHGQLFSADDAGPRVPIVSRPAACLNR